MLSIRKLMLCIPPFIQTLQSLACVSQFGLITLNHVSLLSHIPYVHIAYGAGITGLEVQTTPNSFGSLNEHRLSIFCIPSTGAAYLEVCRGKRMRLPSGSSTFVRKWMSSYMIENDHQTIPVLSFCEVSMT